MESNYNLIIINAKWSQTELLRKLWLQNHFWAVLRYKFALILNVDEGHGEITFTSQN